ncbi:MAG: type II CAAX prenyl endopeptidase Rce1 family protein [Anaerovoracaceae bacterium]
MEKAFNSKVSKTAWIAIPLLYLGYYGATSGKLPLNWIWMTICGAAALIMEFGLSSFKDAMSGLKKGSWKYILIGIVVTLVISFLAAHVGTLLGFGSVENANANVKGSAAFKTVYLLKLCFSLIGEELMTAAFAFPAFALLRGKMSGGKAWIIASVFSAVLFGLMHVNIYEWNMYQCIVATGLTRLPFNWVWRKSDSLWGGVIAHVVYDCVLLIPALFLM